MIAFLLIIILGLWALTYPSFVEGLRKASLTQTNNNMKDLHKSLTMFAMDHNGSFPSDIYHFDDKQKIDWQVSVNGKIIEVDRLEKGYVQISRKWKPGDKVELSLPMPVRKVYSHPNIEATRGKVALMRGPVLYCLEGADHNFSVLSTALAPDPEIEHEYRQDLLGGVTVLNGNALNSKNEAVRFMAIPYYAWQNRGIHEMTAWIYQDIDQLKEDQTQNRKEQEHSNETIKELTE